MNIIIQKEIALHQYEVRTCQHQLSTFLHTDFQEIGRSGSSYDLKTIFGELGKEQPNGSKIHSQDYESIALAPDVCLLLYKSATIDNTGNICSYTKRSSIWVRENDNWQMKFHQGTPCEPFIIKSETTSQRI